MNQVKHHPRKVFAMDISQEALTLMRQSVQATLAENLKMAGLASVLTGNNEVHSDLVVPADVLTSMRGFQQDVAAYNLKLAKLAAVLTGAGTPSHTVQVDGGPNTIKPPVGTGPHDL
jgi:hypothetical protein